MVMHITATDCAIGISDTAETAGAVVSAARLRRMMATDRRAREVQDMAARAAIWMNDMAPHVVRQREGLAFLSVASELGAAARRVTECFARYDVSASRQEEAEVLRDWAIALGSLTRQALFFLGKMNLVGRALHELLGKEAAYSALVTAKPRFDFVAERASAAQFADALAVDYRLAGKMVAEHVQPEGGATAADRVRRSRWRSRKGFSRFHLNVHVSDTDTLVRMGFLSADEVQDKDAVEAAAQAFVSASFLLAGGASADEGLLGLADRIGELNSIDAA